MKSILRMRGKAVVKQFRPSRVAKRFVQERDKKGHTLGITQQGGEVCRHSNALSYDQLESCADVLEAKMEFVRKNAQDLHKNIYKVQGTDVQTNIVVSRSDCHDEDREFLVDSGASLHMISKNALTAETMRKSKEPHDCQRKGYVD